MTLSFFPGAPTVPPPWAYISLPSWAMLYSNLAHTPIGYLQSILLGWSCIYSLGAQDHDMIESKVVLAIIVCAILMLWHNLQDDWSHRWPKCSHDVCGRNTHKYRLISNIFFIETSFSLTCPCIAENTYRGKLVTHFEKLYFLWNISMHACYACLYAQALLLKHYNSCSTVKLCCKIIPSYESFL